MDYNKQQLKAINHPPAPLLILAGAGTGKTTTIVGRIARLIKDEIASPDSILSLTYTVKAAENLKKSLIQQVGQSGSKIIASNYHAFAQTLHNEFYKEMGYSTPPEVMNEPEIYFMLRENFDKIPLKSTEFKRDPINTIINFKNIFDRIRDELLSFEDLEILIKKENESLNEKEELKEFVYQCEDIMTAYPLFQQWKQNLDQIDFGDMIWNLWNLICNNEKVLNILKVRFKHIIVDEFQDNNFALSSIVQKIAEPENSITVVGDDDQSIYSFRGANIGNVHQFVEIYAGYTDFEKIPLMENYRSDQKILDLANVVIRENPGRLEKGILNSPEKGVNIPRLLIGDRTIHPAAICKEIKILLNEGESPENIAILTRTNAQCEIMKNDMILEGIPVNYTSDRLFDHSDIKDLVAWINVIADSEWSFHSLIRLLKLKFNEDTAFYFSNLIHNKKITNTENSIVEKCIQMSSIPVEIRKFCQSIIEIKNEIKNVGLEQTIWKILIESKQYVADKNEDLQYEKSIEGINQFRQIISNFVIRYKTRDIKLLCRFINVIYEVNSTLIESDEAPSKFSVQLMTVHNAKGMEFNTVFIPYLSSSIFPMRFKRGKVLGSIPFHWKRWKVMDRDEKDLHIEEERRLFYVAITRAKKNLILLTTEKRQSMFVKHLDAPFIQKEVYMIEKTETNIFDEIIGNLHQRMIQESSAGNFENSKLLLEAVECVTLVRTGNIPEWNENPYKKEIEEKLQSVKTENIPVKKPRLSASSIGNYQDCPLKFKYKYIHKVEEKRGKPYFSLGNTIHKVLEVFHRDGYSTMDDLFMLMDKHWNTEGYEFLQEEEQNRRDGEEMLKKYYNYFKSVQPHVFSTEKYFEFDLSNCTLTGKCDRIDVNSDGQIRILDYKTGKKKMTEKDSRENLQLPIYAIYARQSDEVIDDGRSLGKIPEYVSYLMLRQDDPEISIQLSDDELNDYTQEIETIASEIESGNFEAKTGYHCNRCDYKNLICSEWN